MSDANKFINTYVDIAVSYTHDYLNTIIQLKTQLKLANDLASEKDQVISGLQTEIDSLKNDNSKMNEIENNARNQEAEHSAMKNRVAHMDTLTNQYNQLKADYIAKDEEIKKLNETILKLKEDKKKSSTVSPKKSINKEDTKSSIISKSIVKEEPIETDDF